MFANSLLSAVDTTVKQEKMYSLAVRSNYHIICKYFFGQQKASSLWAEMSLPSAALLTKFRKLGRVVTWPRFIDSNWQKKYRSCSRRGQPRRAPHGMLWSRNLLANKTYRPNGYYRYWYGRSRFVQCTMHPFTLPAFAMMVNFNCTSLSLCQMTRPLLWQPRQNRCSTAVLLTTDGGSISVARLNILSYATLHIYLGGYIPGSRIEQALDASIAIDTGRSPGPQVQDTGSLISAVEPTHVALGYILKLLDDFASSSTHWVIHKITILQINLFTFRIAAREDDINDT